LVSLERARYEKRATVKFPILELWAGGLGRRESYASSTVRALSRHRAAFLCIFQKACPIRGPQTILTAHFLKHSQSLKCRRMEK
jgi:hypothetical protein